jgi:hypothetical protein
MEEIWLVFTRGWRVPATKIRPAHSLLRIDFCESRGNLMDIWQPENPTVTITSDVVMGPDGKTRWKPGGEQKVYSGNQFWWSQHDPEFVELLDRRGRWDVDSPGHEWTRVDCICEGDRITVQVNGVTVNACYEAYPRSGKILLQAEGFEIFFRRFELHPLSK